MPFSRFEKLAPEKRERLLEFAAREFAKYGFAHASINRIIEQAHMSKGATYYYFEDKVDLFCTVVRYAIDTLQVPHLEVDLSTLSATSFWPMFAEMHRQPLLSACERPWLFIVISVAAHVPPSVMEREPLASLAHQIQALAMGLIKRGQELGVIRTDLPDELLFAWLHALDHASDQWLMGNWERLELPDIALVSDQTVAAISKAMAPEDYIPGGNK